MYNLEIKYNGTQYNNTQVADTNGENPGRVSVTCPCLNLLPLPVVLPDSNRKIGVDGTSGNHILRGVRLRKSVRYCIEVAWTIKTHRNRNDNICHKKGVETLYSAAGISKTTHLGDLQGLERSHGFVNPRYISCGPHFLLWSTYRQWRWSKRRYSILYSSGRCRSWDNDDCYSPKDEWHCRALLIECISNSERTELAD